MTLPFDALKNPRPGNLEYYREHIIRALINHDPKIEIAFRDLNHDIMEGNPGEELETLKAIQAEVREHPDYETAIKEFKTKYNAWVIPYKAEDDGKTHINVYSKGNTSLGKLLSNFAHTPFTHPEFGHFSSMEAFWYWIATGMKYDELRGLYGMNAKTRGKEILDKLKADATLIQVPNFKSEMKKAILLKITQNPQVLEELRHSSLPLIHYYVWGKAPNTRVTYPAAYAWIHEYISDVRDWLKGKKDRIMITGVHDDLTLEALREMYMLSGLKPIEIITRGRAGPDGRAIELARELELPYTVFTPNWESNCKDPHPAAKRDEDALKSTSMVISIVKEPSQMTEKEKKEYDRYQHFKKLLESYSNDIVLVSWKLGSF